MPRVKPYRSSTTVDAPTATASHLLDCPNCHHFIGSHDVHMDKGIAKCTNCDHVFSFQEFVEADPIAATDFGELPTGLDILKLRSLLEIRVNHYHASRGSVAGPLLFAFFWNICLLPFLFFIVSSGQWHVLFFISLHLFAGVSMLRNVFGQLFNRTTIEVSGGGLKIRTKPFGSKAKAYDLSQISHFSIGKGSKRFNTGSSTSLIIHLKNGKKESALVGIDRETLTYIKSALSDYIN